jgi:hypothetical protein
LPVAALVFPAGILFDKEFQDVGLDRKLFASGWAPLQISIQHNLKAREEAFLPHYFCRI